MPEDISVVGFDDSLFTPYLDPPLTTIRQPVREMSLAAVGTLLDEMGAAAPAAPAPSCSTVPNSSCATARLR
ncbi:substrate-binding domain-containing protein [Planobispora siamensis]|uniref:Transcriptional regulator LacI/GalR-like sensor domain-containing protein n=1 Tax=Planobispora siamensis TaxID=936338 RepID=A0A8J3SN68_9ACTN|nr:hypothetical protein Psi01_81260 [Planobispora siamensis]